MNGGKPGIEQAAFIKQLDGAHFVFGHTGVDVRGLFGDMHVQGHLSCTRVRGHFAQVIQRHGSKTMRRNPHPCSARIFRRSQSRPQRFGIGDKILYSGSEKSDLRRFSGLIPSRPHVGGSQQCNPQAGVSSGAQNLPRQLISIGVGRSARGMMHIMEFADGSDPTQEHFEESHPRGVIQSLRRQPVGGAVHAVAPGPERIVLGGGTVLGPAAQDALEGV